MRLPHQTPDGHSFPATTPQLADDFLANAKLPMAPRVPDPLPSAIPNGAVTGFGTTLNLSTAAEPFSHGLDGVNQPANFLYTDILFGLVAVLLTATAICNWVNRGRNYLRHLFTLGRETDQRFWENNSSRLWAWIKRHILYAPLFRSRHNKGIQLSKAISIGTLPSRFHTILLVSIYALNLAFTLALTWDLSNPYSIAAELRGRTGWMSVLNLLLSIAVVLRNNPMMNWFAISYDTMNLFHRWFARLAIAQAVIHVVCWGVNNYEAGGTYQLHLSITTSTSYEWGMTGVCLMIAMGILAFGPLRHAFYETFLAVHRLLAFIALLGVYLHLYLANLPQLWYVQLSLALWALEWVWRVFRVCYHNFSRRRRTHVLIEALPSEAVRVTFDLARPWHWKPGCYVHIYLPTLALWSSHPFSVAWAENRAKALPMEIEMEKMSQASGTMNMTTRPNMGTRMSNYSRKSALMPTISSIAEATHKPSTANITLPRDADVYTISCVVRARTGMTRKLYDKAMAAGTTFLTRKFTTSWGAVEGPYGGHHDLASYGTVVLFAGGIGITHQVSFVYHLLLQYQAGTCSAQKILLVWSIPNTEALEWIRPWMDQILRMDGRRDILKIQLFVTKPRHREEVISSTGSVQMFPGRCNPVTILEKECRERIGAMVVTMCGPGIFADPVRAAARSHVEEGVVDFFEEAFTY